MPANLSLFKGIANQELMAHRLEQLFVNNKVPEIVTVENKRHDSEWDDYFHPSTHCAPDARQLYFTMHPELRPQLKPRQRTASGFLTPYFGTFAHAVIQQTFLDVNLVDKSDIEVELQNDEHHWKGHMDLLFRGIPVDIKTMNPNKFKYLEEPHYHYKQQLNCYMDQYPDAPYGILLVLEMAYPFTIKEWKVQRDPKMMDALYEKWALVRESLATNQPPRAICAPCDIEGKNTYFQNCPARFLCVEDIKN